MYDITYKALFILLHSSVWSTPYPKIIMATSNEKNQLESFLLSKQYHVTRNKCNARKFWNTFFPIFSFEILFEKNNGTKSSGILQAFLWCKECCELVCFEKVTCEKFVFRQTFGSNLGHSPPPQSKFWIVRLCTPCYVFGSLCVSVAPQITASSMQLFRWCEEVALFYGSSIFEWPKQKATQTNHP